MSTMTDPSATHSAASLLDTLRARLQRLHRHSGKPSTREIARRAQGISHTTVHGVLRCAKNPRWGQLELVVEALGGEVQEFKALWVAVLDAEDHQATALIPVDDPPAPAGHHAVALVRPDDCGEMSFTTAESLTGHTKAVLAVAFRPDGHLLATGSDDHTVRLWDPTTGQAVGEPLTSHAGAMYALAFHPDGQLLAIGSDDHTVRLWDPSTGQAVGTPLVGHAGAVYALAFHPDGHLLATGSDDHTVRLWDPTTGQAVGTPLVGHAGAVYALAFHPDG
ncbi:hypothetical protein ACLQ2R_05150, partial [Streptosporangium sp. DT93]